MSERKHFHYIYYELSPHQKQVGDSWYYMHTWTFLSLFLIRGMSVCLVLEFNKDMKILVPNANTKLLGKIITWGLQFLQLKNWYVIFIFCLRWWPWRYFRILKNNVKYHENNFEILISFYKECNILSTFTTKPKPLHRITFLNPTAI